MQVDTSLTRSLEKYLDTATLQLKLTAENMANVDTPRFKTKGIDFDKVMSENLSQDTSGPMPKDPLQLQAGSLIDGLISRPDGNNVSMEREGMKMSEAQMKFRTGVALLKQEISQISNAIHSDTK